MARNEARDEALVAALATGCSAAAAAQQCKRSERTVRRRLTEDDFRTRVNARRSELVGQAVGTLSAAGQQAALALWQLLQSGSETVKLSAGRAILDFMFKGSEIDVLARQVEDLRRQLEDLKHEPAHAAQTTGRHPSPDRRQATGA
jgi:hypothetical protein